jgi:hypothetical protein
MGVGVRYVHKQLDRGIEDTGAIDPETDDEPYIIGNPGESGTKTFNVVTNCFSTPTCSVYAGSSGQHVLPKPKRQYDAVELSFDKRLSHNWSFHGSYTLSRDYGNYPGLGESDEVNATTGLGRVSPNIGRLFDYPIEEFDGHGKPLYGRLPTDRTHVVKGQFIYQWPFGTAVGITSFLGSGIPISRSIGVIPGHGYLLYYNGRGSEGRTPALTFTNLYVQHEFRLPGGKRFQINANVLNVFDRRTVLDRFQGIRRTGSTLVVDENAFYAGQVDIQSAIDRLAVASSPMRVDPRFMQSLQFLAPLQARFGFKVLF